MTGYIKTYRKMLEWEWYKDIPVRILFEHCLLKANFEEKKWRGQIIERGSFVTSYGNLAKETGLTVQQVRTAINKLILTSEITHKGHSKYSVITVNNWDCYQANNTQDNKQSTNNQQTNNKQITTTKEREEYKEREEGYIRAHAREDKTLSLIPSESEIQDYCATLGRNIDVKAFMQYYQASNWLDKNGLPVNWKQKVIAWVKNDKVGPSKEGLRPHVSVTETEKYLEELKNAPSDPMPESFLALREKLKIRRSDNELHRLGRGFCTKMGDDNPQENYANNGV